MDDRVGTLPFEIYRILHSLVRDGGSRINRDFVSPKGVVSVITGPPTDVCSVSKRQRCVPPSIRCTSIVPDVNIE